jgi:hypothetical protein
MLDQPWPVGNLTGLFLYGCYVAAPRRPARVEVEAEAFLASRVSTDFGKANSSTPVSREPEPMTSARLAAGCGRL